MMHMQFAQSLELQSSERNNAIAGGRNAPANPTTPETYNGLAGLTLKFELAGPSKFCQDNNMALPGGTGGACWT
jgi:hypothetical protein